MDGILVSLAHSISSFFSVLHPAQEFFTYIVTITGEGLQNLDLISLTLRAFEQGGIFIVPHLL
jgi:hypothetical protein